MSRESRFTRHAVAGSETGALLDLSGVSKRFGGIVAAADVSLALPAGKVTTLVGPNGAGKTTLFNIVTGNIRPDQGQVSFRGQGLSQFSPQAICRLGIARSFQHLRLFSGMSVYENVLTCMENSFLPWQPGGRSGRRRRAERTEQILAEVGLAGMHNSLATDLGFAEQKFLSLARVIARDASLWLLDEPASGMDPSSYAGFVKLIRKYVAAGTTIFLIEHNLDIVKDVSDHVAFLDQGRVLAVGDPDAILKDSHLASIYFGKRHGR